MKFKAGEIAHYLHGEVIGDQEVTVSTLSKIEEAKAGSLAFLSNPKYEHYLYESEASVILVSKDFTPRSGFKATLIRVEDSYQAFTALLQLVAEARRSEKKGIEQPSFLHETAEAGEELYFGAFAYAGRNVKIGKRVKIYPQVYIGDQVTIGDDTVIYAGARIYQDTKIGERCIIHSGAVVGSDGFGFAPQSDGSYQKIPQLGNVIVEDDVEIGANTTIDCGTMGPTIIRRGVKLDNLIQIAHNCEVGDHTVMAALTGLAGSSRVGRHCRFGGQVGLAGHLTIGDNVQIGAQSGVVKDIPSNQTVLASPAIEYKQAIRMYTVMRNLPQLRQEVIDLRKEIKTLEERISK